MKKVFISYSTKDKETAAKVKAALEQHGIEVTIDRESMRAGGNIREFIDKSIRETQVTLSIVSENSLASDWVAFESVESFSAEKFAEDKKFIACYIDDGFLVAPDFMSKALAAINDQIKELKTEIERVELQGIDAPINLTTKTQRKIKLKNNLPDIILRLQESLTLDIREPEFETSMKRIIAEILDQPLATFGEFPKKYLQAFTRRKVFISYSTKDKETAAKVKAGLEAAGITVTIDSESLPAGGNIRDFIDKSIRETDVTLSIVSKSSLKSDWVALESVESFAAEKFLDRKMFLACYLDDEFLSHTFLLEAVERIDQEIEQLDQQIAKLSTLRIDPVDLQAVKTRKFEMRNNLSKILDRLRSSLTLDIREPEFDNSLRRIVDVVRSLRA